MREKGMMKGRFLLRQAQQPKAGSATEDSLLSRFAPAPPEWEPRNAGEPPGHDKNPLATLERGTKGVRFHAGGRLRSDRLSNRSSAIFLPALCISKPGAG